MTTNMRETISQAYQAGIEVGRNAAKQEMAELAKLTAAFADHASAAGLAGNVIAEIARKPTPKAAVAPKAPTVSRGVKKAAAPHAKGVKEGIVTLIGARGVVTVSDVIAALGFKESSVRATLMGLKKKGIATSESGRWSLTVAARESAGFGNSEAAATSMQQPS